MYGRKLEVINDSYMIGIVAPRVVYLWNYKCLISILKFYSFCVVIRLFYEEFCLLFTV
jgi:hypothetical protein